MQKIHRVNLVRLNLLKSREIIERHWICPGRNRPGPYKKKYGDAFENEFLARGSASWWRFTRDSYSKPGRWIDSTWFSSFIERPWIDSTRRFNGFKFNRRHPLWTEQDMWERIKDTRFHWCENQRYPLSLMWESKIPAINDVRIKAARYHWCENQSKKSKLASDIDGRIAPMAGLPWFESLVIFDFFAPWYRRSREASSVKIS